ncbi:hypothetical protein HPB48_007979 [Haemaphysalis longicornis]|uniref:U4/U6.U5 small nuclear ribonucleoprotein 27 kDa protein n=1 Tax=Haemaphysalis longicornis TaxID=44386 RepID=A0A9J6FAX4_HAELO|nr:hypothetical protein HPB48_007979 [Haemaphysalis longicornis]
MSSLETCHGTGILTGSATGFPESATGAGLALCLPDFATGHLQRRRPRSRSPRRRSRSPRRRSRSRERKDKVETPAALPKFLLERPPITAKDLEGKTEEEKEMMKLMGFGSFDSSKGKHIPGNNVGAVHVIHKRKYRQYMNRKGGFNRPLDYVA